MPESNPPAILVFSTLFPSSVQPNAGVFIRERMFRVGEKLPLCVVSPVAWFPFQGIIRRWRPHFRPLPPRREVQDGIEVYHPRFFSVPGYFKFLDGLFLALSSLPILRRIRRGFSFALIDSHFGYPDGYAAVLLGKWLNVPVTITLRGTEVPQSRKPRLRPLLVGALQRAERVFSVSDSLRRHAIGLGVEAQKIRVVGNGVDTKKFHPVDKLEARRRFSIPEGAKVMVSVGALVERKGFHRVIELIPGLLDLVPELHYLIIGGASPEGDRRQQLEARVKALGLEEQVHFLGAMPAAELKWPLSAADIFVLATSNEGWANVFLEAMACGVPVVTTDVGGNAEVVCRSELGTVIPFGDWGAFSVALAQALAKRWDHAAIRRYASDNSWENRVDTLVEEFSELA